MSFAILVAGVVALVVFSALSVDAAPVPDDSGDDGVTDDSQATSGILDNIIASTSEGFQTLTGQSYSAQILAFAQAIAQAEGFGVAGVIPTICNNPGDLTKGDFGDTGLYATAAGNEQIIRFASVTDGFNALYQKLQNIVNGNSSVYNLNMTILDMANTYVGGGGGPTWANNVAVTLGVPVTTQLSQVLS